MNPLSAALLPLVVVAPLLDPVPEAGDVKPGWGAAALVAGLLVVTVLLWFSMRKQLGRIRFDEQADASEEPDPRRENGAGPD